MEFMTQEQNNESKQTTLKSSSTRKTALQEMRARVESAVITNHLQDKQNDLKKLSLWGVPLLPSTGHGGTDAVLQKFLKARGYRVEEALEMLEDTLEWRRQYKADQILEESLSEKGIMYLSCRDKEGHPLIFFGVSTETENEEEVLRWRVQYLEKAIKELKFDSSCGGQSLVQITDFNNSPKAIVREMSSLSVKSWQLLHQHYPELIHRKILINVPFWYYASHFLSSRVRGPKEQPKIVVARPSREAKTLLKFISAENLPVEYGGLRRENDEEFCQGDKATELVVRADGRGLIRLPVQQVGATVVWEVTVVGWDVLYKEEFVPQDEGSYTVLLREEQKENNQKKKSGGGSSTDNIIRNCFYIREAGHILITVDNDTMKKKRVFYRCKTKNSTVPC